MRRALLLLGPLLAACVAVAESRGTGQWNAADSLVFSHDATPPDVPAVALSSYGHRILPEAGLHSVFDPTVGPVIGVLAQPKFSNLAPCDGVCEYIAASYVKWVESAGGRVLPVPYNASFDALDAIFASVNGLLFPGGSNVLSVGAKHLFSRAREAHEAGDYFPVWGTCLGLEWMVEAVCAEAVSKDPEAPRFVIDTGYDAWNLTLPLSFTEAAKTSRLFHELPPALWDAAAAEHLTMNNHHKGVAPAHLAATPALSEAFTVISTDLDRSGTPFVSTLEGKDGRPWYGVQFHPEKAIFEWGVAGGEDGGEAWPFEATNHSLAAQNLARYLADFFVGEARKNRHAFPETEGPTALSWGYPRVYSGPDFVESYFIRHFHYPPDPAPGARVTESEGEGRGGPRSGDGEEVRAEVGSSKSRLRGHGSGPGLWTVAS
ncbi:gamma-glutamyl hydrolase [Nannochloropsis gaditana]|uniref:folate gamma-glutamyl hydrolase n=1 Tax=Nannochloropsis gaditana TaxID=72520 RepID=W7TNW9_9STRA|nr:gamma-glutamyl hydrolase [Nannochloropsis gaditana]